MTENESQSFREQRFNDRASRRRMRMEHLAQRRAQRCQNMKHTNKSWFGICIIVVGIIWLLNVLGVPMPGWLFTWPVWLIAAGLFGGLASGFRNNISVVLILIGAAFLARNSIWPDMDISRYVWPVLIIFIGIMFLLKRKHWDRREEWIRHHGPEIRHLQDRWANRFKTGQEGTQSYQEQADTITLDQDFDSGADTKHTDEDGGAYRGSTRNQTGQDWLDVTTLFGGARRTVISKNFKGGDLTNICGGTVLDLTHADVQGMAVIDVVGIWGGIKVAVPPDWEVRVNVTHLMAGTDDRRRNKGQDGNKVLVFTGTMLMAGIEITDEA